MLELSRDFPIVTPANGTNGGLLVNLTATSTEVGLVTLYLVQKYLMNLYVYSFTELYCKYKDLSEDYRRDNLILSKPGRDREIYTVFDEMMYDPKFYKMKARVNQYHATMVYVHPSMIQTRIKERIIWYAGNSVFRLMHRCRDWLNKTTINGSMYNKINTFLHSDYSHDPKMMYSITNPYIPQLIRPAVMDRFFEDRDFDEAMINYNTGCYDVPKLNITLSSCGRFAVEMLRTYIQEDGYKAKRLSIKIRKDPNGRLFAILNFHIIKDKDMNPPQRLSFTTFGAHKLDKIYLDRTRKEYFKRKKQLEREAFREFEKSCIAESYGEGYLRSIENEQFR